MAGDTVRDLLWELVGKIEEAEVDLDSLPVVAVFACAMALLQRRRDAQDPERGGRFGGAGASATWLQKPTPDRWLSPSEAARRIGRSVKWLSRRKRSLPFIRPLEPEGRGFVVSEKGLEEWMAKRK